MSLKPTGRIRVIGPIAVAVVAIAVSVGGVTATAQPSLFNLVKRTIQFGKAANKRAVVANQRAARATRIARHARNAAGQQGQSLTFTRTVVDPGGNVVSGPPLDIERAGQGTYCVGSLPEGAEDIDVEPYTGNLSAEDSARLATTSPNLDEFLDGCDEDDTGRVTTFGFQNGQPQLLDTTTTYTLTVTETTDGR